MSQEKEALNVYRSIITEDFISSLKSSTNVVERQSVLSSIVTVWLMIFQRLNGDRSLEAALVDVQEGVSSDLLNSSLLRIRRQSLSGSTGGYSRARSRLPLFVVEEVSDKIQTSLNSTHKPLLQNKRQVFMIDGTSIRLPYTEETCAEYPQYKNQYGKAHYPLMRVSVVTDVVTGIVSRPAYGAFNGSKAESELALAEELLPRLPSGSVVIGDRYYGNARFACTAEAAGHDCICRVKEKNAKRYIGGELKGTGEKKIIWESKPSPRNASSYSKRI